MRRQESRYCRMSIFPQQQLLNALNPPYFSMLSRQEHYK